MKKEVVYSLLAAAAFPGMAYANANAKSAVSITSVTGAELDAQNSVYVSNDGTDISFTIGTFYKGKYNITIENIDATKGKVTVTVNGKSKETTGTTVSESVTIEGVEITGTTGSLSLTASNGKAGKFQVGTPVVELDFDFKAAHDKLIGEEERVVNAIRGYSNFNGVETYIQLSTPILADINKIADDGVNAYQAYIDFKLYEPIDANNSIMQRLATLENDAAHAYQVQLGTDVRNNEYKNLTTKYDAITNATGKARIKAEYEAIEPLLSTYDADVESNHNAGKSASFDYNAALTNIKTAISSLSTKIDNLDQLITNNNTAYEAVKSAIETATAHATDKTGELTNTLPDPTYTNLRKAATKALGDVLSGLTKISKANDANNIALIAADHETALKDSISAIVTDYDGVFDNYTGTLKDKLEAANTILTTQNGKLTKAEEDYEDVIANHEKEHNALKDAIKAVSDAIDKANSGDCTALNDLDLSDNSDLIKAVDDAVAALENACAAEQAEFTAKKNAVATANSSIEAIQAALDQAKTTVDGYKFGEEKSSTYYTDWVDGIQADITALKTTAETNAANVNVKSNDKFYTETVDQTIAEIQADINNYTTKAQNAANKFNSITDDITEASEDLAAAKAKVVNLPIYSDNSLNVGQYNYKTNVETAEAEINRANKAKSDALALKTGGEKIADAVIALTFNKNSVDGVANHINTYYQTDYQNYSATALARQKATLNTLWSDVNPKKVTIEADVANTSKPLGKATDAIKAVMDNIKNYPTQEDITNATADDADGSALAGLITRLNEAKVYVDSAYALRTAALAHVAGNAQARTDITTYRDGKYIWTNAENEIKVAGGAAYTEHANTKAPENDAIDALIDNIKKNYVDSVETKITESYSAENLAEDEDAIKAKIDETKAQIDAAKAQAKKLNDNYTAYKNLNTKFATIDTHINNAKTVVLAISGEASQKWYVDEVLIGDYQNTQAVAIKNSIKETFENTGYPGTESEKLIGGRIDALIGLIDGVAAKAQANQDAYDAVTTKEDDVNKTWNEQNTNLQLKDQSSERDNNIATMQGYLSNLNTQREADKDNYLKGKAADNQSTSESTLETLNHDIIAFVNRITDPTNYDPIIEADNKRMFEVKITGARNDANNAYNDAAKTLNAYKNLKSTHAQTALAAVQTQYDALTNYLYDMPKKISDKFKEASDEYGKTFAPNVFDRDSVYVNDFRGFTNEINSKKKAFLDGVVDAFKNAVDLTSEESQISSAKTTITTYDLKTDDKKGHVYDELDGKLANIKNTIEKIADNADNVKTLDDLLYDIETNFATYLKNGLDNAAALDLAAVTDAQTTYQSNLQELKDAGETDAATQFEATYNSTLKLAVDKKNSSESLSDDYAEIKSKFVAFRDGNNAYKDYKNHAQAFADITTAIDEKQKELDAAKKAIIDAGYSCVNDLGFDDIQSDIDALRARAEGAKTGVVTLASMQDDIDQVSTDIDNATSQTGTLLAQEKAYLLKRIADVKDVYTLWAANNTDAAAAEWTYIQQLEANVNAATKASDLLPLETSIRTELKKLQDEKSVDDAKADLNDALKAVSDKAKFADGTEPSVIDEYTDELNVLKQEISDMQATINDSDPIFDKDKLLPEIDAIGDKVDELLGKISAADQAAKAKKQAEQTARANATTAIDNIYKLVTDSQEKLDKYTAANAQHAAFAATYKLCTDKIDAERAKLAATEDATTFQLDTELENYVKQEIGKIENSAAYRQLDADYDEVQKLYDAINDKYGERLNSDKYKLLFHAEDKKALKQQLEGIQTAITRQTRELSTDYSASKFNGYSQTSEIAESNYTGYVTKINSLKTDISNLKNDIIENMILVTGDANADGNVDDSDVSAVADAVGTTGNDLFGYEEGHIIDIADVQTVIKAMNGDK